MKPYEAINRKIKTGFTIPDKYPTTGRTLSSVLSVAFHPLLIPVAGTLFILFWSGLYVTMLPAKAKEIILLIVGTGTLVLPAAVLFFCRISRRITGFHMPERRERILPLILSTTFYYMAYRALQGMHTPLLIQKFVLAATVAVFLASAVSLCWKISLHGIGIGGFTGMMVTLSAISPALLPAMLTAIILSGVVGYARIRLDAHTPAQYYAGTLLGCCTVCGIYFLL